MYFLIGLGILLVLLYASLMCFIAYKFLAKKLVPTVPKATKHISYTIIIAARNEAKNIGKLLQCLNQQNATNITYNILVINDNSTDNTIAVVANHNISNLKLINVDAHNSGKKNAITTGIKNTESTFIITLDADVVVPSNWLATIHNFITAQQNVIAIALPVFMQGVKNNLLANFQTIDFLTMQGITEVAVNNKWFAMCNGANFLYSRKAFLAVNGFVGNANIASGDDMFLLQKLQNKYTNGIYYLANQTAAAFTSTEPTLKLFFNQRIRWASKAKSFTNNNVKAVLLLVYLLNVWFFIFTIFIFCNLNYALVFVVLFILKIFAEYLLVQKVAKHFQLKAPLLKFIILQPFHIVYIILSASFGLWGKYTWKGRPN